MAKGEALGLTNDEIKKMVSKAQENKKAMDNDDSDDSEDDDVAPLEMLSKKEIEDILKGKGKD